LNVEFDDDGRGGFTVTGGKLTAPPEGWKEVCPGRWEPQWPACVLRGLSTQVALGVPTVTIHCNEAHKVVGFNDCEGCQKVRTWAGGGARQAESHTIGADDSHTGGLQPSAAPLEVPPDWPVCSFQEIIPSTCCFKAKCIHPNPHQAGRLLKRSDCIDCTDRQV
jgi:hypothetical protein